MFKRNYLYDFGLSQDDPSSELRALELEMGDRVLCIASAGEVPLEFLVKSDESVTIDAIDISEPQLYLSNLKLQASRLLDGKEAAAFLGYQPAGKSDRDKWFRQLVNDLPENEAEFWQEHPSILKKGPVHLGRYETYISLFAPLGRFLLGGRKRMLGLFECTSIEEQKKYFDHELRSGFLRGLFKIMFSRKLYKSGGISEKGLIHMGEESIGRKFYRQFRGFCTDTPVRKNWLLQFVLFNRVIFDAALPAYLQQTYRPRLEHFEERLRFVKKSYTDIISESDKGEYNKLALSNVSDWLSVDDFVELLLLIAGKSEPGARGLIRYIHSAEIDDPRLKENFSFDYDLGKRLLERDRFPFYKLIPFTLKEGADERSQ